MLFKLATLVLTAGIVLSLFQLNRLDHKVKSYQRDEAIVVHCMDHDSVANGMMKCMDRDFEIVSKLPK